MKKKIEYKKVKLPDEIGKIESIMIFRCNCRCVMCSTGLQIDRSLGQTDYNAIRPFEEVKSDIDKAKKKNAKGFAFSGGEPTLRKDLPLLVAYAKAVGIGHIEVQSNGKMYFYKEYCEKLIEAGVNHFVISFHSCKKEINDFMMGVPGTYEQVVKGIKNLNELGQSVKINVVITKYNYEHLEEHIKFLSEFDLQEIRFTMVMLEGNTNNNPLEIVPKMSLVGPYIGKGIDVINKASNGKVGCFIYNMVPCLMPKGYRRYINDMGQLDTILLGPEFESSLDEVRKGKKIKSEVCKKCKYDSRCYGIWKKYAKLYGLDELIALIKEDD